MNKKPNILFILTDQFRPDMLGSHTPNINSLAARGVKFENCYTASPLCQPGRSCIITGKFPSEHGVCGNMSEPISMEERKDTFMQHLQKAGYYNALIGKHHYYDRYNVGMDVVEDDEEIKGFGFDHVWQILDIGEHAHNNSRYTSYLEEKSKLQEFREKLSKNYYKDLDLTESVDGYIGEMSLNFINDYDKKESLYLNIGFVGPHPPYWTVNEYDKYSPDEVPAPKMVNDEKQIKKIKEQRAIYKGKIKLIDDYIGKLCQALENKDMLDNTVIIFSADHGDNIGDYGITDKRFYFEQSVKVPLIMAGPGIDIDERVGGTRAKELVNTIDLYPTFLDIANYQQEQLASKRKGISLLKIANERTPYRNEVYSELGTSMMVRDANWKLVYDAEQDGVQYLFNLRRDPDELENLAGVAGYENVEAKYVNKLLTRLIKITNYTQAKEQQRVQRVRV